MSAVLKEGFFKDQSVEEISFKPEPSRLRLIIDNVTKKFTVKPKADNIPVLTDIVRVGPKQFPIQESVQEPKAVGAFSALKSDILNGNLVRSYQKHNKGYFGNGEELESALEYALNRYFENNPDLANQAGAYTNAKKKLFANSNFRQKVSNLVLLNNAVSEEIMLQKFYEMYEEKTNEKLASTFYSDEVLDKNLLFNVKSMLRPMINDEANAGIALPELVSSLYAKKLYKVAQFAVEAPQETSYKPNFNHSLDIDLSTLDIASTPTNPVIEKLSEWKEKFQNIKAPSVDTVKNVAFNVAAGASLKAVFNSVAVASGVGIVAIAGYGVAKSTYDGWKHENLSIKESLYNASGFKALSDAKAELNSGTAITSVISKMTGFGKAKEAWNASRQEDNNVLSSGFAFLKNINVHSTLKNSAMFAVGASVAEELVTSPASAPQPLDTTEIAQEPVVASDAVPVEPVEAALTNEEMAVPSVFDEELPESVQEEVGVPDIVVPELSPFETVMVELGDNPSSQDIKDAAVEQLWNEGGNQEVGVQLMQEAAKMGNLQAIRDMADLQEMGMAPSFSVDEQLASITVPDEIQARIDSSNISTSSQALNDVAIGALNDSYGIDKNFPLGVGILERLAGEGHAKSISDLHTLTDLGMVDASKLSSDVQMKIGIADGALASCSQTISPCEFADGVPEQLKAALSQTFEKAMETGDIDKEVTSFYQESSPDMVASIK